MDEGKLVKIHDRIEKIILRGNDNVSKYWRRKKERKKERRKDVDQQFLQSAIIIYYSLASILSGLRKKLTALNKFFERMHL